MVEKRRTSFDFTQTSNRNGNRFLFVASAIRNGNWFSCFCWNSLSNKSHNFLLFCPRDFSSLYPVCSKFANIELPLYYQTLVEASNDNLSFWENVSRLLYRRIKDSFFLSFLFFLFGFNLRRFTFWLPQGDSL